MGDIMRTFLTGTPAFKQMMIDAFAEALYNPAVREKVVGQAKQVSVPRSFKANTISVSDSSWQEIPPDGALPGRSAVLIRNNGSGKCYISKANDIAVSGDSARYEMESGEVELFPVDDSTTVYARYESGAAVCTITIVEFQG